MKNKSVMTHQFRQLPAAEISRSSFDRSHGHKTAFDGGKLIPIYIDEALPGDTFNLSMDGFARLATPIFPIMDNMWMETFFFAVPNRLVWDNWQKFNGEQADPGDSIDFTIPTAVSTAGTGYLASTLFDHFGIPPGVPDFVYNVLPLRAYNLIWTEWFRDQNLQDSLPLQRGNGPDTSGQYSIQWRGKRHDYFTSALPWPQKGDEVTLNLGTQAPISGIGVDDAEVPAGAVAGLKDATGIGPLTYTNTFTFDADNIIMRATGSGGTDLPDIYADLTNATAITINAMRQAFQVQKLQERDARGGTRYTEIIRSHFGVTSPDARLQRPEYLGGGSTPVNITPVASTAPTTLGTEPQGVLAGFGTASIRGHGFTKSFTEHCYIIGLVTVRADITYQQGVNRLWNRQTRFDFFWPALQGLGEQGILNKEIYAQGTGVDDQIFGYQERYAEYRYKPSEISSFFRSSHAQSLDAWHLSQDFQTIPQLGVTFIEDRPPIDRIIAVDSEPHFLFDAYFNLRCARPMPLYGVPGHIDHF